MLFSLMLTSMAWAQEEEETPPPENKIVCIAAKKQWVCAPADEQEKAQEKAMQLVNKQPPDVTENDDTAVVTQPAAFNNNPTPGAAQPVTPVVDNQVNINEQIKDFIPRAEANEPNSDVTVETATVSETVVEQQPEPTIAAVEQQTKPIASPAATAVAGNKNNFNDWQLNHAEQWSFQVIGTSNRHQLDAFISDNGLQNSPHVIVKTSANGADWWVVLAGLYDSRDAALAQRQSLPSQLASQAWVRQIKSIDGKAD
ncbi:SPOR domain-containing protein [Marinicella sp. S1101]|nr:SPOR domain-containing protein [Marinicella marina]MCX7552293.1 SPOR domain-containing protein [Marinicella marina]MDJ1139169.1 SPOR domain-containing protein [Marinicella marina]